MRQIISFPQETSAQKHTYCLVTECNPQESEELATLLANMECTHQESYQIFQSCIKDNIVRTSLCTRKSIRCLDSKESCHSKSKTISADEYLSSLYTSDCIPTGTQFPEYSVRVIPGDEEIEIFVGKHTSDKCEILSHNKLPAFSLIPDPVSTNCSCVIGLTESTADGTGKLSHGYRVTIPNIGDILVSYNGDIVLSDAKITTSILIDTPNNVVLQGGQLANLSIRAKNVIVTSDTTINSLNTNPTDEENKLCILPEGKLVVNELNSNNSLVLNDGSLTIRRSDKLKNTFIINNGQLNTPQLSNINYLWNTSKGLIQSTSNLILSAANVSNLGKIFANTLSITIDKLLDNQSAIQAENGIQLYGGNIINHGVIEANLADKSSSKGNVSSTGINIQSHTFTNTSGRIEAHGDIVVQSENSFKNGGGERLEKDVVETITVYEPVEVPLAPSAHSGQFRRVELKEIKKKIKRDVYCPDLEKSGVITTNGGELSIKTGIIDNSFGVLHGKRGVVLQAQKEAINECGLIHSSDKLTITSEQLRNGYRKDSANFPGVDPNKPILKEETITGRWHGSVQAVQVKSGLTAHNLD